jgi:anion-transporting  ArsA/GET3 family ATPase
MDIRTFLGQSHILVVAGKGGVGKTTMVAALAHLAAGAGLSVLIVELEGRDSMGHAFDLDGPLGYDGSVLAAAGATAEGPGHLPDPDDPLSTRTKIPSGSIHARTITPDDALLEYLDDHGLRRISKRLMSSGIIDIVAGAIPGIRDILVLGKIKQLERAGVADLILVDAPATGHAMTFLSSASGLLDAARGGPIRAQATEVVDLLSDPARCQVVLVTLPEEMPINEAMEAAFQLEDRVGVALGPVIVNGCYPTGPGLDLPAAEVARAAGVDLADHERSALDDARHFRSVRHGLQHEQLERLAHDLPLDQLRVPYLFTGRIGPDEINVLGTALATGIAALGDPAVGGAR